MSLHRSEVGYIHRISAYSVQKGSDQDFSGVIWTMLYGRLLLCQREKKGEVYRNYLSYLLGKA